MIHVPDPDALTAAEADLATAAATRLSRPSRLPNLAAAEIFLARVDPQFALYRKIRTVPDGGLGRRRLAGVLVPVLLAVGAAFPVIQAASGTHRRVRQTMSARIVLNAADVAEDARDLLHHVAA